MCSRVSFVSSRLASPKDVEYRSITTPEAASAVASYSGAGSWDAAPFGCGSPGALHEFGHEGLQAVGEFVRQSGELGTGECGVLGDPRFGGGPGTAGDKGRTEFGRAVPR